MDVTPKIPKLSFVVVEYHSEEDIRHCLANIGKVVKLPYEVVVTSNSCYSPAERQHLQATYGTAKWVFNDANGGFAYAMNEGMKLATGDYIIVMNADCVIDTDLTPLVSFMEQHPELGAAGPQIRDHEGNIQDTARPYVSLDRYCKRQMRRILRHQESILEKHMDYEHPQTVDWIIGAFMMVTRKAYELTGGMDSRFFMYAEDLDWCTRIRQKGLEVVYYPLVHVTYKGTRRARSSVKYAKIFIKSHLLYWRKFGFFSGYPPCKHITY